MYPENFKQGKVLKLNALYFEIMKYFHEILWIPLQTTEQTVISFECDWTNLIKNL